MDLFYYCALDENSKTCPRQNECKRYLNKKAAPPEEDANAKLFNICNKENRYKLFMKREDINEERH